MEADFAFRGIDFRDLYRRGSGMTPRRLLVLIKALPPDSLIQRIADAEVVKAEQEQKVAHIRERTEYWNRKLGGA